MYKTIFLILLAIIGLNMVAYSQDTIVTKDAKKIAAKVLEINKDDVKYKNFGNLDGPTYTLLKTQVATIIYQNGDMDVFDAEESIDNYHADLYAGFQRSIHNDDELLAYLSMFDKYYFNEYRAACSTLEKGHACLGFGIPIAALGVLLKVGINEEHIKPVSNVCAYICMIMGSGLIIASIPLMITGGSHKTALKSEIKQKYFSNSTTQPTLNFGFVNGGVGLTLNF